MFIRFDSMAKDYRIQPGIQHYIGLVEVLRKSGHLNEAVEFIEKLPFEPTMEVWECLMNLARSQGGVELEEWVEEI